MSMNPLRVETTGIVAVLIAMLDGNTDPEVSSQMNKYALELLHAYQRRLVTGGNMMLSSELEEFVATLAGALEDQPRIILQ